ncbi:MAG: ABC transporter ATP-binding protein [Gemmatimonadetes bacterium]|nr:ABC transporter ATP-binding protein [Gemmatimonadota bacterium]
MTETILSLSNVEKRYGSVLAAIDVTFDVRPGELLVLLGPSGCGKSTLLRLISGLEAPDHGRITSNGRVLSDTGLLVPPEQRHISLVFQDNALFPHMTVRDNVSFGLPNHDTGARKRVVADALNMVQLGDVGHRYPHELSGGQQQRVALARALAPQPKLVLLDEPFSDLDRTLRIGLREEVRAVLKANGTSTILVTHDQEEALAVGDRIAVQRAGRIEQIGAPEELFSAPRSRFVAEFVGETDFIRGEITADGIQTELGVLEQSNGAPVGTTVDIAIRADDVAITADPNGAGTVVSRVFTGTQNVYRVRLGSGQIVRSLQPHTLALTEGTSVQVRAEPGHNLACFPAVGSR